MRVVSGKILSDKWRGELGPAIIYVRLLDASRIDASARVIVEVVLEDVMLDRLKGEGIEFRMVVREIDPRVRYVVRVLVDMDGDGQNSVGDYTSTHAHPVLTRGFPDYVEVPVQRIG